MESKDKLKEVYIKSCSCNYFNDIMWAWDRDTVFRDILLDEKLYKDKYKNILLYDISYKTSTCAKPLRIRYNKNELGD